jgi:hypothetical protein
MTEIKYNFPYWGPFMMEIKDVNDEFIDLLLEKGNESRKKNLDYKYKLAGMIDNEYAYDLDYENWFVPLFQPYLNVYLDALKSNWLGNQTELKGSWKINSLWINYQKALEYNPPHHHSDDISFVMYLQVPDEIRKENEEAQGIRNNPGPGMICFDYGSELPYSINTYYKLPSTGTLFMFPSWLTHHVHAFQSDVERISVSGNITI